MASTCDSWCFWRQPKRAQLYYWVPCAHKDDFRRLSLFAVSVRGEGGSTVDFFEATIRGIEAKAVEKDGQVQVTVILDKEVPNYRGHLIARIKGRLYENQELIIQPVKGKPLAVPGKRDSATKTDRLRLVFEIGKDEGMVNATMEEAVKDLVNQNVRLLLEGGFVPNVSKTSDLLEDIRRQLELIRLNQQFQAPR